MLQPPWCFRKFGGETQLKQNQIALINTVLMKTEALSRARHHFEQIESTGREKTQKSRFAVLRALTIERRNADFSGTRHDRPPLACSQIQAWFAPSLGSNKDTP
jgi:hypothetical protein